MGCVVRKVFKKFMMPKKILVTGGCGFIGSNYIIYMLEKYEDISVINLDALTYAGNPQNLKSVESDTRYSFVRGNICDSSLLSELLSNVDAVVNFAAESHVDRSIEGPEVFVRTNVLGTQILLEESRKAGIKKFVHISTDEVYGTLGEQGYFIEATPLAPNSPYSASKASSDLIVRSYVETYDFPAVITRCSNNYGPYQFPEKLIPLMIHNALNDKQLPVYGDGLNVRDWLYVEDHCCAIDRVLELGNVGEIYNVGGSNEMKNIELVKMILAELGKPVSLIEFVDDRLGHDRRYAIDARKIKDELGWEPKTELKFGLKKTIKWYINNKKWLRTISDGTYQT